jgi:hypothetical protein
MDYNDKLMAILGEPEVVTVLKDHHRKVKSLLREFETSLSQALCVNN